AYPEADRLLICADGGGSNGYRVRLWKYELSRLATETGLDITVCHLPPGTSKWNKIEHRLFSHISMNWRGRPLTSHAVVVELIGATTTKQGLRVHAERDLGTYPPRWSSRIGRWPRYCSRHTTSTASGTTPSTVSVASSPVCQAYSVEVPLGKPPHTGGGLSVTPKCVPARNRRELTTRLQDERWAACI